MGSSRFPDGEVREFAPVKLESPTVVAGFVGAGLVGPIAAGHIVSEKGLKEFACMRSRHLPPAAVFLRGHLQHPFRFYADEPSDTCVIMCEATIHMEGVYDIISAIFDWIEANNARELVILDGIASDAHDGSAYYAAEKDTHAAESSPDIKIISKGFLTGISGGLLDECLLHDVRGSALLVKAKKDGADPGAAATLVSALDSLCKIGVSPATLLRDAEGIGDRFAELSRRYTAHRSETRGMYM